MNDILKIRYTVTAFDYIQMQANSIRHVYELFPDGKVTYACFERGSRKAIRKSESHSASADDYRKLCEALNACIDSADRMEQYIDDSSAEVTIFRPFGRIDTMDRGYGNTNTDVGTLIAGYIHEKVGLDY